MVACPDFLVLLFSHVLVELCSSPPSSKALVLILPCVLHMREGKITAPVQEVQKLRIYVFPYDINFVCEKKEGAPKVYVLLAAQLCETK